MIASELLTQFLPALVALILAIYLIKTLSVIAHSKKQTRPTTPMNSKQKTETGNYQFTTTPALMTDNEFAFFRVLNGELDHNEFSLMAKVRMADLFAVKEKGERAKWAFNRIKSKHFDFALINAQTGALVCLIELDDSSHNKEKAKKNDEFKNQVCRDNQVVFIRFKAAMHYDAKEIADKLQSELMRSQPAA